MSRALMNLRMYKSLVKFPYRILLSVHDAIIVEVEVQYVPQLCEEVIPNCMTHGVEVPGTGLHYSLGKFEVMERWSEHTPPERLEELGVPKDWCGYEVD